jgi:hypothetical protein
MGGPRHGLKAIWPRAISRARRNPSSAVLACLLPVCVLLACLPTTALAVPPTYDARGEWTFTLETTKHKGSCVVVIREVNAGGEFTSQGQCNGSTPGQISGTISGTQIAIKAETQTPAGHATFTSTAGTVESAGSVISASGSLTIGSESEPATLAGTRLKTYLEVQEREAREKKEQEQREKEARERAQKEKEEAEKKAKEKEEQEAAERPAREQREREATEKAAREAQEREATEKAAREKQEHEAAEKQAREKQEQEARAARERQEREAREKSSAVLVGASPVGGSFTRSSVSLSLANANGFAVSGRFTLRLTAATGAGRKSGKKHATGAVALGEASFSISPNGSNVVKVKLTRSGRAALARHKTLPVKATITTQGSGQAPVTKTYSLTLRASAHAGH